MFGGGDSSPAEDGADASGTPAPAAEGEGAGVAANTGHDSMGDPRMAERVQEKTELLNKDRLDIGGLFYMRNGVFLVDIADGKRWWNQQLTMNNLVDVYFDARPNDRVRAFIRGRMLHNPVTTAGNTAAIFGISTGNSPVTMVLDQLWLKTDINRRIYLTVGNQHVRWGATRLWNPVDVIYATRRNPLTLFDQRTGLPMVKLQVPIEVKLFGTPNSWNAYLIALNDSASDLEHVGVAGRLEAVIGTAELGFSAVKRKGKDARFGVDWSAGVWELDVTGEFGVRLDANNDVHWMVSGGLQYGFKINDDDTVYLGAEYFHNPDGFADASGAAYSIATTLAAAQASGVPPTGFGYTPFYVGQNYAAFFAVAAAPGSWDDTNFTVSVLSNLSDGTGVAQLIVTQRFFNDLTLELSAGAFFGSEGEFRGYGQSLEDASMHVAREQLKVDPLPQPIADQIKAGLAQIPRPAGQIGANLRLAL